MKRTATLEDVARKAHVSKMTVSRVINHPELVASELQVVVEDAMHKLNYHPNNAARALAKNQTSVVKFVILEDVDDTDPYFTNVLFGMATELKKQNYSLQLLLKGSQLDQGAADGYVITGARTDDYPQLNELKQPFVLFGENRGGYDFVDTNNLLGETMATKYALKAGYRNVVFIGIDVREAFEFSREAGYVNTMQQNKKIPSVFRVENSLAAAREFIQDHLGEFPKNTCFACATRTGKRISSMNCSLFVSYQNMTELFLLIDGIVNFKYCTTWITKNVFNAFGYERLHNDLCT